MKFMIKFLVAVFVLASTPAAADYIPIEHSIVAACDNWFNDWDQSLLRPDVTDAIIPFCNSSSERLISYYGSVEEFRKAQQELVERLLEIQNGTS